MRPSCRRIWRSVYDFLVGHSVYLLPFWGDGPWVSLLGRALRRVGLLVAIMD
jgi:hypothetical protein